MFENVVWKVAAILSQPQFVRSHGCSLWKVYINDQLEYICDVLQIAISDYQSKYKYLDIF